MERITVDIGFVGTRTKKLIPVGRREDLARHTKWLSHALSISPTRARALVGYILRQGHDKATGYITVILTFEQLGRYVALRTLEEGYPDFWTYPRMVEVQLGDPTENPGVIELRPGRRSIP